MDKHLVYVVVLSFISTFGTAIYLRGERKEVEMQKIEFEPMVITVSVR